MKSLFQIRVFATPWTVAYWAPLPMGFSRQEYWSGVPLPSPTSQLKCINSLVLSFLYCPTLTSIHDYQKNRSLTVQTFVGNVMSLLFNMLSRLVITFLPRSKRFLISWLQTSSTVILEPPKNKVCHCFHCFPISLPWSDGTECHDLSFWMLSFKPIFSLSSFTFIKRLFSSSSLPAIRVVSSACSLGKKLW